MKNLVGSLFERWTVLERVPNINKRVYYKCICACGVCKVVLAQNLTSGKSKSCGCFQSENITSFKRTDPILVTARRVWLSRYQDGCSFETFFKLSQLNCFYCGEPPSNHAKAYTGNHPVIKRSPDWAELCQWTYNGLDRIDSSKNHQEDNIVPCCILCNQAKNDLSIDEFKSWIEKVYKKFVSAK